MSSLSPPDSEAEKYRHFHAALSPHLRERLLFPPDYSEVELQSLWFAGAFGRRFESTCGKTVEIVQFGTWNHSAGPDFSDTVVSVDGDSRKGSIELDTDVRDWERHQHSVNPAYDGVVLHLFFYGPEKEDAFTRTSDHRNVIQVRLARDAVTEWQRPPRFEADAHLGRCSFPLRDMEDSRIASLLRAAARHRLDHKARRFVCVAEVHGPDQAWFQAIAEALGYRPNKLPMTVLAQRAPLNRIRKLSEAEREALLFGLAGFLDDSDFDNAPPETRNYLRSLWQSWWKQRGRNEGGPSTSSGPGGRGPSLQWNLSGVRPTNHPHRRIAALAVAASRWDRFVRCVRDPASFSETQLREFFRKLDHPYWTRHYTLQADQAGRSLALVGGTRVAEILANQIYPVLIPENPALWEAYEKLPARLDNERLRHAVSRLFGDHPRQAEFTRKVFQQQGLLQVYQDFCLDDDSDCTDCPFPEQLKQWR